MQIPLEVLSSVAIRTDSGAGGKNSSGQIASGSSFGEMFGSAIGSSQKQTSTAQTANVQQNQKQQSQTPNDLQAQQKQEASNQSGQKDSVYAAKPDEEGSPLSEPACRPDEEIAAELAMIVPENQNEVVFILERDKESATTPEMRVYTEDAPGETPELSQSVETESAQIQDYPDKPERTDFEAVIKDAVKDAALMQQGQEAKTAYTHNAEEKNAQIATVQTQTEQEVLSVSSNEGETYGEVTARMPIIRTSDWQENSEQGSGFSKNGNLSPLENENDSVGVKTQNQSTFTETVDTVKEKAEYTIEQPINPMPLSDVIKPERFAAEQQVKQAALDAPVRPENLFDEMVSRLESMKTDTQSAMTIHLRPEFLGKVALELAMDAAGLHVKISAADSGVRAMINGQITALIESLENKGIEVVEVEVAYTGVDNGAYKESREDHSRSDSKRRLRREINKTEGISFYNSAAFETRDYYLEAGVSSVEYSA